VRDPKSLGRQGEDIAAGFLQARGYRILQRNWRCRAGEIDIVAREGKYLCFVEVKTRDSVRCGVAEEAVDFRKRKQLSKLACLYLSDNGLKEIPVRFDVVAISGNRPHLIRDAFQYS
jgi:putative endonuclease